MKKTFILFVLSIIFLLLTGCAVGGMDVRQESATGLAGELLNSHSFGQTFLLNYNGLYRIDLYTATYARINTHPVIFKVCSSPACHEGGELIHLELQAAQISNNGPTIITFPAIGGTAGNTYYFSIESPGSVPGDAISVYRNDTDVYPDGQMFIDGLPTSGDIAFIAYTNETFTFADIRNNFFAHANQDKPFFIFYCLLLGFLLLALVLTLARRPKPPLPSAGGELQPPKHDDEGKP